MVEHRLRLYTGLGITGDTTYDTRNDRIPLLVLSEGVPSVQILLQSF